MNVVDSSAWLEYFAAGANADFFAAAVEGVAELVVPTLSLFEVFERVMQQRSDNEALQVVAVMQQGHVVDLDAKIALSAARLSLEHKLPLADSIMLATARTRSPAILHGPHHLLCHIDPCFRHRKSRLA